MSIDSAAALSRKQTLVWLQLELSCTAQTLPCTQPAVTKTAFSPYYWRLQLKIEIITGGLNTKSQSLKVSLSKGSCIQLAPLL